MIAFYRKHSRTIALCVIALLWLVCTYRLLLLVAEYSVNLLYWDHFELYRAYIQKASPWELFRWQHGSHRQGLSFILSRLIAEFTDWNTTAESLLVLFFMSASAVLLLALKRRLYGRLHLADAILPVAVLSPLELEIYLNTPNASHGAFPLFLLLVFALSWTARNVPLKIGGSLLTVLALSHSGFGLLFPPLYSTVLLAKGFSSDTPAAHRPRYRMVFLFSLAILFLFFSNYETRVLAEASGGGVQNRLLFVTLMSAHAVFGFFTENVRLFALAGAVLFAFALAAWIRMLGERLLPNGNHGRTARKEIELVFLGFSLVFMAASAMGRASMDLNNALNSRYFPYLLPGLAALYFHCLDSGRRFRMFKIAILAVLSVSFWRLRPVDREAARKTREKKRAWAAVYRETENVELANRTCGFRLNVTDKNALIQQTFDYCRRNRLNLYCEE